MDTNTPEINTHGLDPMVSGDYERLVKLRTLLEVETDSPWTILVFAVARINRLYTELEIAKSVDPQVSVMIEKLYSNAVLRKLDEALTNHSVDELTEKGPEGPLIP